MTFFFLSKVKPYAGADFVTYKINEQFGSAGNNSSSILKDHFQYQNLVLSMSGSWYWLPEDTGAQEDTSTGMHSPHSSSHPQSSKVRNGSLILSGLCSEPKCQEKLHLPHCCLWEHPKLLQKYVGNGEQAGRGKCLPTSNPDECPFYLAKRSLRTWWKE